MTDPSPLPRSEILRGSLRLALAAHVPGSRQKIDPQYAHLDDTPRIPTGLAKLDAMTGGIYGVTTITGQAKVGKSFLAQCIAIQAAASMERRVLYLNAEIAEQQVLKRFGTYLLTHEGSQDAIDFLHIKTAYHGADADDVVTSCLDEIQDDLPLLCVVDSINTCIAMSQNGRDYFGELQRLILSMVTARRASEGDFAALLVAEQNSRGDVKGLSAAYYSDLLIKLTQGESPGLVQFDVTHSRESQSGFVGNYVRRAAFADFAPSGYTP